METWEKHDFVKVTGHTDELPPYGEWFMITEYPEPQPQFDSRARYKIAEILARRKAAGESTPTAPAAT
jgi:hypothetical protein